jgi:hypothetical protein
VPKFELYKHNDELFNIYYGIFLWTLNQLSQWFLRRRFLCEFPIGSYVKLSSAVGAILIERLNRRTHFWRANLNQTLLKWFLGGPLPKLCPAFQNTDQDGHHSRT